MLKIEFIELFFLIVPPQPFHLFYFIFHAKYHFI